MLVALKGSGLVAVFFTRKYYQIERSLPNSQTSLLILSILATLAENDEEVMV